MANLVSPFWALGQIETVTHPDGTTTETVKAVEPLAADVRPRFGEPEAVLKEKAYSHCGNHFGLSVRRPSSASCPPSAATAARSFSGSLAMLLLLGAGALAYWDLIESKPSFALIRWSDGGCPSV